MKVKEFIEKYNSEIGMLEIKKYIPIAEKFGIINPLVDKLITNKNRITADYNTVINEILIQITAVNLYTNLEVEIDEGYDLLMEANLMSPILSSIGTDYCRFHDIFESRISDKIRQINSIDGAFSSIQMIIKDFIDKNPELLKEFNELVDLLNSLNQ